MKLLRIVTLASSRGAYGGPYDTATRQAIIARQHGIYTTLLSQSLPDDRPLSVASPADVELPTARRIPGTPGFTGVISFSSIATLVRNVRHANAVHISAARELFPMLAAAVAIAMHKPVIAQPHGMLTSRSSVLHRVIDHIAVPLFGRATTIIALTDTEAHQLTTYFGPGHPPIAVVPNPLPPEVAQTATPATHPHEALFIARLHPRKRVGTFLAAAVFAAKRDWPEVYQIYGPDGGDQQLVQSALGTSENVDYGGALTPQDVVAKVANTGVFVLTAKNEPWGNIAATAIALGIPVVVPKSAAIADLVMSCGCGRVIPDEDPAATAIAVHELLTNAEEWAACSKAGTELANRELSDDAIFSLLSPIWNLESLQHFDTDEGDPRAGDDEAQLD